MTTDNAAEFLAVWKRKQYSFVPLGVIHGLTPASYSKTLHTYIDMGYRHVALGGLVPRADSEILKIVCAVRQAIQERTRNERENVWVHLFGILRPKLQPFFRTLGVSSFDSASYLRKAWLRSDQNYLSADGRRWYGSIRVPLSRSKAMRKAAEDVRMSAKELARRESLCLRAIEAFDGSDAAAEAITSAIDDYGPLLERKTESNHFMEEHKALLTDQPWERCPCKMCQTAGIDVVVFRGAHRNKRRGLHNTWVFYHRVLHGKGDSGA